jgi:[ribosomal protein S5]-alanine N-acetyltransferase
MILQFDNYCIRDFSPIDVIPLVKYANNYAVSRFLRDAFPHPYTQEDAVRWINFVTQDSLNLAFAIADENELIGGIGAIPNQDVNRFTSEIGYWLAEPFWNKGLMTKAVRTFCGYLFANYNFNHLTASIYEGNDASMKVVKKVGFILEGVLRKNVFKENKYLDQYIYGLLKEDFKL